MNPSRRGFALGAAAALALGRPGAARAQAAPRTLQVGPGRELRTLAQAAQRAGDGTQISVDAGTYVGDTAVWTQSHLALRAAGGRVRLVAGGAAAEDKAIWVVRARGMSVEGFDFEGAAVADRNGAGIRLETGSLRVRDCSFVRNEMGLLTNNDGDTELDIENSEFAHNQRPDGHNHNLYVGAIRRLSISGSYLHHGHIGHLLKSRAALNRILYNRLTDEADGSASYELEFPNGGVALVLGNLIGQSARTENPALVSYGAEGGRWPANALVLAHNTLIDDRRGGGIFVRSGLGVAPRASNNLLVGPGRWDADGTGAGNVRLARSDFEAGQPEDRPLLRSAAAWGRAVDAGMAEGLSLHPTREYRHPRHTVALMTTAPAQPGALQSDGAAAR